MGSVLTPLLSAGSEGAELPGASSLCGACTDACPVEIPLADLLVRLRADRSVPGASTRDPAMRPAEIPLTAAAPGRRLRALAWAAWAQAWSRPRGYALTGRLARVAAIGTGARGWRRRVPGLGAWTGSRDLPLPAPQSFHEWWKQRSTG
jgi:L-lactate dehydrogenase complex protein LldF